MRFVITLCLVCAIVSNIFCAEKSAVDIVIDEWDLSVKIINNNEIGQIFDADSDKIFMCIIAKRKEMGHGHCQVDLEIEYNNEIKRLKRVGLNAQIEKGKCDIIIIEIYDYKVQDKISVKGFKIKGALVK